MRPVNEDSVKPIIVEERLNMNELYKIEIIHDATNFCIAKSLGPVENSKTKEEK